MTESILPSIGGCAANVATDLAKIGRRSAIVGRIGADFSGRFVKDELAACGVETDSLVETPGWQTSSTLVINVKHEDRRFIHTFGASSAFDGSEVSDDLLRRTRILYLGGFFLMPQLTAPRVAALFRQARRLEIPTVLDVVIPDPSVCRKALEEVLPETDVFLPNVDEGGQITGLASPIEQAQVFRNWGAATAVVTCGGDGTVLADDSGIYRSSTFPVEFIDGTGSGDAFCAGYISGMLDRLPALECLKIGSALGASCVRRAGATTGVFNQSELADFLASSQFRVERLTH